MRTTKFVNRRILLIAAVLALTLGMFAATAASAQGLTYVRVAHLSPDTPAVEVYLNGEPSGIQVLKFGEVSGWVELPAGTYSVAVAPAGAGIEAAAIGPANFTLPANTWITVAATGSLAAGTLGADVAIEDYSPITLDEARVTVFHAIEDAPAVDVILPDGTAVVSNLAFGQAKTITVPAGTYNLAVVPAGSDSPVVIDLSGTQLNGATYYFVAATNTLASPKVALSVVELSRVAPLFDRSGAVGTQTIAEIAAGNPNFSTLVTALDAAGLVDTLNNPGSFTVFAPTNAAFAALPAGTLDAVLADKDLLTTILLYHVLGGKALASDVVGQTSLNMLDGGSVTVEVRDGKVFLNDTVQIVTTDIVATNGVIHIIDGVLLPG
jgi:uncharacterized surface protein with fasciclin (FAS1) repeats